MRTSNLEEMKKGWFIGDFVPSLYRTREFEAAVKEYRAGDYENAHFHKIATEYTVVAEGIVRMNNVEYGKGSIIIMEPGETTDFYAVTDAINVVVKIPGASGDKYEVEDD